MADDEWWDRTDGRTGGAGWLGRWLLALGALVAGTVLVGEAIGPLPERSRAVVEAAAPAAKNEVADRGGRELVIEAGANGHYVVDLVINGQPIAALVDSGASDLVLTPNDARSLGLEPLDLEYSRRYRTASGTMRAAPVRLEHIAIGEISLYDVEATVAAGGLPVTLLGMSVLDRLEGFTIRDGRLVLHW